MLRSVVTSVLLPIILLGFSPVAEASYPTIKTTLGTIVIQPDD